LSISRGRCSGRQAFSRFFRAGWCGAPRGRASAYPRARYPKATRPLLRSRSPLRHSFPLTCMPNRDAEGQSTPRVLETPINYWILSLRINDLITINDL
jgi:hypothetical protein